MPWAVTKRPHGVELDLRFPSLTNAERSAVGKAAGELKHGHAPQTRNHRAAALYILGGNREIWVTGVNTDSSQRGKQCAEPAATAQAQVALRKRRFDRISLVALAVVSKRYFHPDIPAEERPKDPPTGPCGSCLTHLRDQANFANLEQLSVVMGAGNIFRRAAFRNLYPLSTIAELDAAVRDPSLKPHGVALIAGRSCCDALDSNYQRLVQQDEVNKLLQAAHQELRYSSIDSAPGLSISYSYLIDKKTPTPATFPLIDTGSPIGQVSGLLPFVSGSKFSVAPNHHIKALVIAVDHQGDDLALAGRYQFFTGAERQRIFDLADLTNYDIPVFISWRQKHVLVAHISALAPLFEGPRQSSSSAKNLPFYTPPE